MLLPAFLFLSYRLTFMVTFKTYHSHKLVAKLFLD